MSPVKATVSLPCSASSKALAIDERDMKLPASRAHVTILLERESAIVLILDLLVPRSGGFCSPDVAFDEKKLDTEDRA
jgi:hypothetical protein